MRTCTRTDHIVLTVNLHAVQFGAQRAPHRTVSRVAVLPKPIDVTATACYSHILHVVCMAQ